MATNALSGSYQTSFSGTDITAVFGNEVIGTLQAISYSVSREKGPVYTMRGGPNPLAFARGKRGFAGTLIFITIDEASLLNHFTKMTPAGTAANAKGNFYGTKHDIRYNYKSDGKFDSLFDVSNAFTSASGDITLNAGSEKEWTPAYHADQILPFDVNLSAANEFGKVMKKSFIGVETMNEGGGISIDDLVIEEQYTYVCRDILSWTKVSDPSSGNRSANAANGSY